jgi:hypothetical protein
MFGGRSDAGFTSYCLGMSEGKAIDRVSGYPSSCSVGKCYVDDAVFCETPVLLAGNTWDGIDENILSWQYSVYLVYFRAKYKILWNLV